MYLLQFLEYIYFWSLKMFHQLIIDQLIGKDHVVHTTCIICFCTRILEIRC